MLGGIARAEYAGRQVIITNAGRRVASTTARADGTFQVTARLRRGTDRYQAIVAGRRSPISGISPVTILSQDGTSGGVRVRGRLTGAGAAGRRLVIRRQVGCPVANVGASGNTRTSRSGTFSITLPRPAGSREVAVYRLTVSGSRAFQLVLVRHDA